MIWNVLKYKDTIKVNPDLMVFRQINTNQLNNLYVDSNNAAYFDSTGI